MKLQSLTGLTSAGEPTLTAGWRPRLPARGRPEGHRVFSPRGSCGPEEWQCFRDLVSRVAHSPLGGRETGLQSTGWEAAE